MYNLFRDYFRHAFHCPECDMYFHEMGNALRHWHHYPHKHHHCNHWFADKLRYTNKPSEIPFLKKHLDNFQLNLTSYLSNFLLPCFYQELSSYERLIENKYIIPCRENLQLVDAVVFVPKKEMRTIKTRIIVEGGHGIYLNKDILRDREFEVKERGENKDDINEPQFNEPEENKNYEQIVQDGKIVGTTTWVETLSLLGCCCKMKLNELNNEISKLELDNVVFKNNVLITDKDLNNEGEHNLNVIFLCEQTLNELTNQIDIDDKQTLYKRNIGNRFSVAIINDYFNDNAVKLTFAHELGHILFGHLENTTRLYVNRETQANFLASLMLNDKIDSIYMQYKTNFQPREYQKTMLFHNDFNSSNFLTAFFKIIKLT